MNSMLVMRYRSWRYRRAIRANLRSNQRKLDRKRKQAHEHNLVIFGADKGVLIARCTICGQTQEQS
ncbi:MAG TPA: hypothetical protein PLB21_00515 [Actinomycetota bacterium]|nr:hypothetical protein [Actinomycetota bacterium]